MGSRGKEEEVVLIRASGICILFYFIYLAFNWKNWVEVGLQQCWIRTWMALNVNPLVKQHYLKHSLENKSCSGWDNCTELRTPWPITGHRGSSAPEQQLRAGQKDCAPTWTWLQQRNLSGFPTLHVSVGTLGCVWLISKQVCKFQIFLSSTKMTQPWIRKS